MANDLRVSTFTFLMIGAVAIATAGCGNNTDTVPSPEVSTTSPTTSETAPSPEAPEAAPPNPASTSPETTAPQPPTTPQIGTSEPLPRPDPVIAGKQDCGQMATQSDMNLCAGNNYALSDAKLNEVYQYVRSKLNSTAQAKLAEAEQAWLTFRDGQCEFERSQFDGGSIAPLIFHSCMEQMTDIRIDELNQATPAEKSYEQADKELNQVYQELQSVAPDGKGEQVREVQLSWLKYRDTNCAFESTHAEVIMSDLQCKSRMTETRTQQLQVQLEQWSL